MGVDGRWHQTVYVPVFRSPQVDLEQGISFKVTCVEEKRNNQLMFNLKQSFGALGPDDTKAPASYVVHVYNFSEQPVEVTIDWLKVYGLTLSFEPNRVQLAPGGKYHSEKVYAYFSDLAINGIDAELGITYNDKSMNQAINLQQLTKAKYESDLKQSGKKTGRVGYRRKAQLEGRHIYDPPTRRCF